MTDTSAIKKLARAFERFWAIPSPSGEAAAGARFIQESAEQGRRRTQIQEELDQTPAWWDRQYRALMQAQIPRDAASHANHELDEIHTFGGTTVARHCVVCGVSIETR